MVTLTSMDSNAETVATLLAAILNSQSHFHKMMSISKKKLTNHDSCSPQPNPASRGNDCIQPGCVGGHVRQQLGLEASCGSERPDGGEALER